MVFVGLSPSQSVIHCSQNSLDTSVTYEWKSAVVADGNLGLVSVDEDARVSSRTAATVARHHTVVRPANRLLVDELYGSVARRLSHGNSSALSSFSLTLAIELLLYCHAPADQSLSAQTGARPWHPGEASDSLTRFPSCWAPGAAPRVFDFPASARVIGSRRA